MVLVLLFGTILIFMMVFFWYLFRYDFDIVCFGVVLELFWNYFCVVLAFCWYRFGIVLICLWYRFGIVSVLPRAGIGDQISGAVIPHSKNQNPCGCYCVKMIISMGAE